MMVVMFWFTHIYIYIVIPKRFRCSILHNVTAQVIFCNFTAASSRILQGALDMCALLLLVSTALA